MTQKISAIILTEVVPRLQITSADTRLTYAYLLNYTQKVYEDIYYNIVESNPNYYGNIGYLKAFANCTSSKLSANLTDYDKSMQFIALWVKESSSAEYYTATERNWEQVTNPNSDYTWTSPVFNIYGDDIWIKPTQTADLASAGKVFYISKASNLSGNSNHNLPDGFDNTLINGICYYGFQHLGQEEKALQFMQDFQMEKEKQLRRLAHRSRTRRRMRDIRENYWGSYYEGSR